MTHPSTGARRERFLSGYSGQMFLVVSVGWIGIQMAKNIFPPLLPTIMADLAISPFQAGLALTSLWIFYALTLYPGGRLADQLSRKTILVGGSAVLIGGFGLIGIAGGYPLFLVSVLVIGIGSGMFFIAMRALTADLYVEKRGLAFGLQGAFGNVGSSSAAGLAVLVIAVATWRAAFLPMAVFVLLVAAVVHRRNREPYVVERVPIGLFETGHRVFRTVAVRRILVAYALMVFAWQGVMGFLPTFLQVEKALSPALASTGFAVVFVVGIVIGPIAGNVGDRYPRLPVTAGAVGCLGAGIATLVVVDSLAAIAVAILLVAVGFWSFPPVMQAYLMDTFADESMAGDLGALKTIYTSVGSLGPSYVGFVAGFGSYTAAYAGLLGGLLLSVTIIASVWRRDR